MFDFHTHLGDNLSSSLICTSKISEFIDVKNENVKHYSYGIIAPNKLDFKTLEEYIKNDKKALIGEIGLDSRYDNIDEQLSFFQKALALAKEENRSFTIHYVKNIDLLLKTLKTFTPLPPFIVHNFTSSSEVAKEIYKLNGYISLSERSLKSKHYKELLSFDFLLETDLTCSPFQREKIKLLYNTVATNLNISVNELEDKLDDRKTIFTT